MTIGHSKSLIEAKWPRQEVEWITPEKPKRGK